MLEILVGKHRMPMKIIFLLEYSISVNMDILVGVVQSNRDVWISSQHIFHAPLGYCCSHTHGSIDSESKFRSLVHTNTPSWRQKLFLKYANMVSVGWSMWYKYLHFIQAATTVVLSKHCLLVSSSPFHVTFNSNILLFFFIVWEQG